MPRTSGPRPRKALGQHFLWDSGVLADIARALEIAVRTSLDTAKDVGGIGGSLH